MKERNAERIKRLGVVLGEEHDLDEHAIKRLIRRCELDQVPFSIRGGVFFVGDVALGEKVEEVACGEDCPCKAPKPEPKPDKKPVV